MIWNTQKFNREIKALRGLSTESALHPLRKEQIKSSVLQAITTEASLAPAALKPAARGGKLVKYVVSILLGLGLVGGTALASTGSIPGDFLYPVKMVKEKVEAKVAITVNAKATVEAKHAEERINELIKLESRQQSQMVGRDSTDQENGDDFFFATSVQTSVFATGSAAQATSSFNFKAEARVRVRARQDAENQVKKALEALNKAKEKLEAGHKSEKAVESIKNNIKRLEERAQERGLELELELEQKSETETLNKIEINSPSKEQDPGKRVRVEVQNGFYQKIENSAQGSPTTTRVWIETNSQVKQESNVQIKFESSRQEIKVNGINDESD